MKSKWLKIFLVHHWMLALCRGLCTVSFAITFRTLIGYTIFGMDYYHWEKDVAMAFSTAIIGFCLTMSIFFLTIVVDKLLIEDINHIKEFHEHSEAA